MENDQIIATQMGGEAHDLSMIGLFVQADIVVQIVMIVLVLVLLFQALIETLRNIMVLRGELHNQEKEQQELI